MASSAGYLLSSDYEGISNSMVEALAIGVPVISTNYPSGGASMYIENNVSGLLVKCGDCEEFAKAICYIIENKQAAIKMGRIASDRMKCLTVSNIANKWEEFITKICNNQMNK